MVDARACLRTIACFFSVILITVVSIFSIKFAPIIKDPSMQPSMCVHVLGDSHSFFSFGLPEHYTIFFRTWDNFYDENRGIVPEMFSFSRFNVESTSPYKNLPIRMNWLGPITMHRIGRDGFSAIFLPDYHVKEHDIVVFVFGEIDSRAHIGKQRDHSKRPVNEIIDTLVQNYLATIQKNKALYKNITCVVYSVNPACGEPSQAFYGSLDERILITQQLNARLKQACKETDILFLDIAQHYATPRGDLNPDIMLNGHIHFNHNGLVKLELLKLLEAAKVPIII